MPDFIGCLVRWPELKFRLGIERSTTIKLKINVRTYRIAGIFRGYKFSRKCL